MPCCSVRWCGKSSKNSNSKLNGITFHRFPQDPFIKKLWIDATTRENWFPTVSSVMCSRHFTEDCFDKTKKNLHLFKTAIPTLFLPKWTNATTSDNKIPESDPLSLQPQQSAEQRSIVPTTPSIYSPVTEIPLSVSCTTIKQETNVDTPLQSTKTPEQTPLNTVHIKCEDNEEPQITINQKTPEVKQLRRQVAELKLKLMQTNKALRNIRQSHRYLKNQVGFLKKQVKVLKKVRSDSDEDMNDIDFKQKKNKVVKNESLLSKNNDVVRRITVFVHSMN